MGLTFTDHLNSDIRIVPTCTDITAEDLAIVFFDKWYCENGLPLEIISDHDKLFLSNFWQALHKLTGIKLKMSTAYHSQSDGASECSNKTINQCLRYHVKRNQTGWKRALPCVRFNMMYTINASTGFSPFQLRMGRSPHVIPPLVQGKDGTLEDIRASQVIEHLTLDIKEAQDNMLRAKLVQSLAANEHCTDDFLFEKGKRVVLSTLHHCREYRSKDEKRIAKFMPRYDGPYTMTDTAPEISTVTIELPNNPQMFPTFHTSQVLPFVENDPMLFPSRELLKPPPIMIDSQQEFFINRILDERKRGRGVQYLVQWHGYGPEDDR
jgi:hypothetical protein